MLVLVFTAYVIDILIFVYMTMQHNFLLYFFCCK